jgi:uncharacterized protein
MPGQLNRREFSKLAAGACCAVGLLGADALHAGDPPRQLELFDYSDVRLRDSRFKSQFQAARELFFNIPNDNLLLGFRQRAGLPAPGTPLIGWYGGRWADSSHTSVKDPDIFNAFGQFISGMARMYKATNDAAMLDKASYLIDEWAKAIEPNGYFYYSRNPQFPHYIYEKTVCGLVDMYAYGGNKQAIGYLERITAWAEKNLDRTRRTPRDGERGFSADGTEWYTLSENLYRAHQLTGDARYKNFGDVWHYDNYWGQFNRPNPRPDYRHAYSHCNTLSSAAMTYAVTGDPKYLESIVNAHDWFQRTQVYATGGFGPDEELMPPDGSLGDSLDTVSATFETGCGSWAIFKLSRYLMSFTGQAKYGDWVEKMFYNGIGGGLPMQSDGHTFYYSDYRVGGGTKVYREDQKWCCCSGTYPQAVADYHNLIYLHDHDNEALYVNLFVPSEVKWKGISLKQETAYPESQNSTLTIQTPKPVQFPLRMRIPGWCKGASVRVNGSRQNISCTPGTWANLERNWSSGDQVSIELPMEVHYAPVDEQHPKRVAFVYGPTVLVRRNQRLPSGAPSEFTKRGNSNTFRLQLGGEEEFVPFYSVGFHEPYEMYFDLS